MRLALHLVYDGCLHKEALLQTKDAYLLQSPTSYHMAPNFCETLLLWISVITCVSWKYWPQKILVFHECALQLFIFQGSVKELPAVTKWNTFLHLSSHQNPSAQISAGILVTVRWWAFVQSSQSQCRRLPATKLGTYAKFTTKMKATTISCMDQVLLWPSSYMSLASYVRILL